MPAPENSDELLCPRCGHRGLGSSFCLNCGLPLPVTLAQQLLDVEASLAALTTRRALLVEQLADPSRRTVLAPDPVLAMGAPGTPACDDSALWAPTPQQRAYYAQPLDARPSAAPLTSQFSPQQLLLGAGALLVLLACLFFAAQAFNTLGIVGQGVTLIGFALAATGGARAAHERGLPVTRAALALIGSGIAITAMLAPRLMGLPATAHLNGAHYVAVVAAGGALFALASAAFTRERSVGLVAVALFGVFAPALAVGWHTSGAASGAILLASTAVGMAVLSLYTAAGAPSPAPAEAGEVGGRTGSALRLVIVLHLCAGVVAAGPFSLLRLLGPAGAAERQEALAGALAITVAGLCLVAVSVKAHREADRLGTASAAVRSLPLAPVFGVYLGIAILGFAATAPLLERSPAVVAASAAVVALGIAALVRAAFVMRSILQQHAARAAALGAAVLWAFLLADSASGPHSFSPAARTGVLLSAVVASALIAVTCPAVRTLAAVGAELAGLITLLSAANWQLWPQVNVAAVILTFGAVLLTGATFSRGVLYEVLEVGGYLGLGLGALLTLEAPEHPAMAAATLTLAGLACAGSSLRPARRPALVPTAVFLGAALVDGFSVTGSHPPEFYSGAGAALLLFLTALAALGAALEPPADHQGEDPAVAAGPERRLRERFARTWMAWPSRISYGPTLAMLLVPSLLLGLAEARFERLGWVAAAAVVTLLLGVQFRLYFPQLIGGVVLLAVVLDQLAPLAASAPRFLVFGGLGLLVLAAGVTYERRLADVKALRAYFAQLH